MDLQKKTHHQWMQFIETFPTVVSDPPQPSRFVGKLIFYAYFWRVQLRTSAPILYIVLERGTGGVRHASKIGN